MKAINDNDTATYVKLYEKYAALMKLPEDRKSGTSVNARWFVRSGYVTNRDSPYLNEMLDVSRKLV